MSPFAHIHSSVSSMFSGTHFFLEPISLHVLSISLHLGLLLALLTLFLYKKLKGGDSDHDHDQGSSSRQAFLWHKLTLGCCLGISAFTLCLCFLHYFYYGRSKDVEFLATLLDLVMKTVSWGLLYVYLSGQVFISEGKGFPFPLRLWWGLYCSVSCYFLVDIFFHHHQSCFSEIQCLVSDTVSFLAGVFLCYVGFFKRELQSYDHPFLKEPLLNDINAPSILKGSATITPYASAGLFSTLGFGWLSPLIALGHKKTLDLDDLPQLHSGNTVFTALPIFKKNFKSDHESTSKVTAFRISKALFLSVWKEFLWTAFLAILHSFSCYVGPYLLDTFVECLDGKGEFKNQGYVLALAFLVAMLGEGLIRKHWIFKLQQVGIRLRAVLAGMIYQKTLALSSQSKQGSGDIINTVAVDVQRVDSFSSSMHDTWLIFLQVGLALLILYQKLGWMASVAAVVSMVFVMLMNFLFMSIQERFQGRLMETKDQRMKSTAEILRNMRVLKLQGWEMSFLDKILQIRSMETGWLKRYLYSGALMGFAYGIAPTFVAFATFGTCILAGIPLESGKILSAIATFRVLQNPIYWLPETISSLVQVKVSLDRIASVLSLDEVQDQVFQNLPAGSSNMAIEIVGANFSWDMASPSATLKDINLKVPHGKRVAVCGTVGSGKSTLLSCILGEVPKISGEIKLCGTKAYVAQSPWIQSGTIEDNILFGKDMDREKYAKVIEACCLIKDIGALSFGDQTIIGERGINLSGGQKQRIQIARALYEEADIYLFDDPFSAVDAHTGSHLFKEVLLGCLCSKTVVYVTHQVEFLQDADIILVLKDGEIIQAGMYDEILKSGSDFQELVGAQKTALSVLDSKMAEPVSEDEFHMGSITEEVESKASQNLGEDMKDGPPEEQLIQEEERENGSVAFAVYWKYLTTACGGVLVPFLLLAVILVQILRIGSNYWLAWATRVSPDAKPTVSESTLIVIYVALTVGVSIFTLLEDTLIAIMGFKTATKLFIQMHVSIFRAPMSFFDATPSGRILNRCSTDQSVVETRIAYMVQGAASIIFRILGIIVVISSVEWRVLIIVIPVVLICIWYQQYYICSARDLSRLVGVCEAPVIQHLSETISGTTTIRGFDQQSRFQETYMNILDAYSRPPFHVAASLKWLMLRIEMFSSTTVALLLVFVVSFPQATDPAIAGLAVTYGLTLSSSLSAFTWYLCHCETKMISAERIFQYTSIPSEGPLVVEANRPDHSWPSYGEVVVDNLQVRYAPHMPLVLHGLTCIFQGGSKTGIVGRTGSGKSTLIQALFRVVEPANGQIRIDGINISSIGLKDLRTKLSIIPQDPTMFEGTIRSNLDPLQMYTDEQIWEALDKCQLGDEVRKMERKLNSNVTENGENWSMGQRQLVCLGRVILKKSKIVVLDEATASVDTATDNQIQQTLKMHFADCTLIIVAHRITSVLDSDMVLLLSHGLVKEHDSPKRLLQNKSSSFSKLVAEYTIRSDSGLIN